MFHILIEVFGGIGLFFVGINFLSDAIKKLGSSYTPGIIRVFSKSDATSVLGGLCAGVATSSGKAVTFSLVPLAELGQLNLRRCLPFIMGGSVGSAFIVLYASFDFDLLVFILMGVAGMLSQFGNQKEKKLNLITHVILGFALLFYGLQLIKLGAAPMKDLAWFHQYLYESQGHWLVALGVGAGLAFISQSGSSVAIIAMSLVSTGLLGFDEAVMIVFGTNVGSGISTAILGLGLRGIGRQLVVFHGFFKISGILVLVPIYALEQNNHLFLIKGLVQHLSHTASMQIAIIYLLYEIVTGFALTPFLSPIAKVIESLTTKKGETSLADLTAKNLDLDHQGYHARIALAHADDVNVADLINALKEEGINVILAKRYESDWITLIEESAAEALLIDLDRDLEHNFAEIEDILQKANVPVFFNEHSAISNQDRYREMSRQLAEKLLVYKNQPKLAMQTSL